MASLITILINLGSQNKTKLWTEKSNKNGKQVNFFHKDVFTFLCQDEVGNVGMASSHFKDDIILSTYLRTNLRC